MHTSTVTVAVLNADAEVTVALNEHDIEFTFVRGTGPGGQHRNTTNSCCVATHKPSGERVRIDLRSQHQSKAAAVRVLAGRLEAKRAEQSHHATNGERKAQLGTGCRGDKVRTYRAKDNQVTDHHTGQKLRLDRWLKGEW